MTQTGGRQRFVARATLVFALMVVALTLLGAGVDQATSRFGGVIWLALLPGILALIFGLACVWVSIADLRDWHALRSCRLEPGQPASDGSTVAVSGQITAKHTVLTSPLFERPCAAFMLRINGQRRSMSSSGSSYRSHLCGLEFSMSEAVLDTGEQRLRLLALPDVDPSFRNIAQGGKTGKRALDYLKALREKGQGCDEADAEGYLMTARSRLLPPEHQRLFVAETQATSNQMSVVEDIVPVEESITVLANFRAVRNELNGDRRGGMKVFKGPIDECLKRLRKEYLETARLAIPLIVVGGGALTCGYWWPA